MTNPQFILKPGQVFVLKVPKESLWQIIKGWHSRKRRKWLLRG